MRWNAENSENAYNQNQHKIKVWTSKNTLNHISTDLAMMKMPAETEHTPVYIWSLQSMYSNVNHNKPSDEKVKKYIKKNWSWTFENIIHSQNFKTIFSFSWRTSRIRNPSSKKFREYRHECAVEVSVILNTFTLTEVSELDPWWCKY